MTGHLPGVVVWSLLLASVVLIGVGIRRRRSTLVLIATLIAYPFAAYLSAMPAFGVSAWLLPTLLLGASYVLRRGMAAQIAIVLAAPYVVILVWLGWVVLSQSR